MCGIAGQFNFARGEAVQREQIERMARSITHRGPDDEGFFIDGPVGLGFRRLSIIDLGGGHQPMSDAEEYRRKSERYLQQATMTEDLSERSRLLTLAAHWNEQAREVEEADREARGRNL